MRLRAIAETETERDFDIVRTIVYRSELFGAPFSAALQEALRGPSAWSVGQRELFAAFVSAQNQCPFWTASHGAVASYALGNQLVAEVLRDHSAAPVDEGMRRVLDLLRKTTLAPADVEPRDVERARRAGVPDEAIEDALYIAAYFNLVDRLADALGFDVLTPDAHAEYAAQFYEEGYGNEVWARRRGNHTIAGSGSSLPVEKRSSESARR